MTKPPRRQEYALARGRGDKLAVYVRTPSYSYRTYLMV